MLIEILAKIETMTQKRWGFSKKGQVTIKVTKTQPFLWSRFPKKWFQLHLSWHLGHNLRISSTDHFFINSDFASLRKLDIFCLCSIRNWTSSPCLVFFDLLVILILVKHWWNIPSRFFRNSLVWFSKLEVSLLYI